MMHLLKMINGIHARKFYISLIYFLTIALLSNYFM